jgi:hypothetical protein
VGVTEDKAKKIAKDLQLTFEEERLDLNNGNKVIEYRYPLETDWGEDKSDRPLAFEEVDLTVNLKMDEVTDVFTQQVMNSEETGIDL